MINRRQLLAVPPLLGLGGLLTGRPPRAFAGALSASERKFIFVFAQGGWDSTRVLANGFGNTNIAMEAAAERGTVGDLAFVDHPDRPAVRSFFEQYASRSVVIEGVLVRSIAHEICTMIAMTGTTSGMAPDWPAVIAGHNAKAYTLPHMVLAGPSYPGPLGVVAARTGSAGQLDALLSGDALGGSSVPVTELSRPAEPLVDGSPARRTVARTARAVSAKDTALSANFQGALSHAADRKDLRWLMNFGAGATLLSQAAVAVDALSLGVARCLTLRADGGATGWDTHADNDNQQSPLWESLFAGLGQLVAMLENSPGTTAATLAEETTVVVLSEMGRTPALNAFNGKDHWPYTSMLVLGSGIAGGRNIGGWDANAYGRTVDGASGELDESGVALSAESVGATLLALADIDPEEYVSGVAPLASVLA